MKPPENFNIDAATADWGQDPTVAIEVIDFNPRDGLPRHGVRLTLQNGWFFSAIWGFATYAEGARDSLGEPVDNPARISQTAEVMPIRPDEGRLLFANEDTVARDVSPRQLHNAIQAAKKNDEDGVCKALTGHYAPVEADET